STRDWSSDVCSSDLQPGVSRLLTPGSPPSLPATCRYESARPSRARWRFLCTFRSLGRGGHPSRLPRALALWSRNTSYDWPTFALPLGPSPLQPNNVESVREE